MKPRPIIAKNRGKNLGIPPDINHSDIFLRIDRIKNKPKKRRATPNAIFSNSSMILLFKVLVVFR